MRSRLGFLLACLSGPVLAAAPTHEIDFYNLNFEYVEGNKLDLDFALEYGQLSNFTLDEDKDDTSTISVIPRLWVQAQWDESLLQTKVDINHLKLNDIDDNDHTNVNALTKYQYKLTNNQSLFFTGMYRNAYEYPGEGISQGEIETITVGDEKSNYFANVGFRYGTVDSVARAEILLGQRGLRYDSRREISSILDVNATFLQGHFDYLATGKTYLSIKSEYEQLTYDNSLGADRDSVAVLLGAKWRHSVFFKVEAYAGIQQVSFESPNLDSDDVTRWELDLLWNPTDYTDINFNARRRVVDATQLEDRYRIVENLLATVSHDFTNYLKTNFYVGYLGEEVILASDKRQDDYLLAGIRVSYTVNHMLSFYVKNNFTKLSSTEENLDFDKNHVAVGMNFAF